MKMLSPNSSEAMSSETETSNSHEKTHNTIDTIDHVFDLVMENLYQHWNLFILIIAYAFRKTILGGKKRIVSVNVGEEE